MFIFSLAFGNVCACRGTSLTQGFRAGLLKTSVEHKSLFSMLPRRSKGKKKEIKFNRFSLSQSELDFSVGKENE